MLWLQGEASGEDYQCGPEDVGAQEMDGLEPDGGKKYDVEYAEYILKSQENEDRGGEAAVIPVRGAMGRAHENPDKEDAREKRDGGMCPAPANKPAACSGEVLSES